MGWLWSLHCGSESVVESEMVREIGGVGVRGLDEGSESVCLIPEVEERVASAEGGARERSNIHAGGVEEEESAILARAGGKR